MLVQRDPETKTGEAVWDVSETTTTTTTTIEIESERTHEDARTHENIFWRQAARWGSFGPEWWLKVVAPLVGYGAAVVVPSARHAVLRNLRRVRGPASRPRDARDVLTTFATYASCVAEVLSNDAPSGPKKPRALIVGERFVRDVLAEKKGMVLVTAHTAGWDVVGPLLGKTYGLDLLLVTHAEPDARAGQLQDDARIRAGGVSIAHVGDPLASLPLLQHLRKGKVVALQLDRVMPGMRTRTVPFLGATGEMPEGPLRLAQLSGAPILPIFCARRSHREYLVQAFEPRMLERRPTEQQLHETAAHIAACMTRFLRAHPTQWFQFGGA